jgi:hypothetical protein
MRPSSIIALTFLGFPALGPHPTHAQSTDLAGRWNIILVADSAYRLDSLWRPITPLPRHDTAQGIVQLAPCTQDCTTTLETSFRVDSAETADLRISHSGTFDIPLERLGIDERLLKQQLRFNNGRRPTVAGLFRDGTLVLVINSGHYHNYVQLVGTLRNDAFEGEWSTMIYYIPLRGHFRMARIVDGRLPN